MGDPVALPEVRFQVWHAVLHVWVSIRVVCSLKDRFERTGSEYPAMCPSMARRDSV